MAVTIKLKNGSGSDPGTSDLVVGEVAVRTDNGKLFTKKDDGTIAEISGSGGGGISDGDKGDITVSNSGGTFTIDNGVVTSAKIADGTIVNADISGSAAIAGSKIQAAGLVNAGVMTAAQHNKLAGIEDNATADMTGSEILSTISGENIILGTIASTGNSTFAGNITMSSSDGGSSAAPELDLYRNSASPADADYLGQIKFTGESDDGSKEVYAKITGKIGDASSGTEDGILEIAHRKAGSNNISARFTSEDLKLINGTGLEVAGTTTMSGTLTINNAAPNLLFTESDANPDFGILLSAGQLKFQDVTNTSNILTLDDDKIQAVKNLDALNGIDVTGDITTSGDLTISSTRPRITLNDTDSESDFEIKNENGSFRIRDIDNPTDRYKINTSGTVHEFLGSAGFSSTLNVVSNISTNGNFIIESTLPRIYFTDTNNNDDFLVQNNNGQFQITDATNSNATRFAVNSDGHVDVTGNLDVGAGVDVTGNISCTGTVDGRDLATDGTKLDGIESNATADQTASEIVSLLSDQDIATTGDITIGGTNPSLLFTDSDDNPDYVIRNDNGVFKVRDTTNSRNPILINTDGHIDIAGNLDALAGVDVTGDITATGNLSITNTSPTISLVDSDNNPNYNIKNVNGVFKINDSTSPITRFSIASNGTVDVVGNLDVGAGIDVTGDAAVSGSVTAPRISGSNGILEVKQEIGTSQTLTSGYNAIAVDPTIASGVTITVPSGATWSIV